MGGITNWCKHHSYFLVLTPHPRDRVPLPSYALDSWALFAVAARLNRGVDLFGE